MIQKLIDQYLKEGGKRPYAVLFPEGVYTDVPPDVFCVWTPLVTGRVVVLPLAAASALLNESMHLIVEEKKETTNDGSA